MILHNHGLLACGKTPGEAFSLLYMLETACKVQVDVMCSNAETVMPDAATVERTAEHGAAIFDGDREKEWAALVRWIERTDPSYRT